jgi:four helix bundle protein
MRDFRKLYIWQKAHYLALDIHLAIEAAPTRRYAGLRRQTLRAAASIPACISEGCGKETDSELARFANMALSSLTELDNHLVFARDARVLDANTYCDLEPRVVELRRMLFAFERAVRIRARKKKDEN